MKKSLVSITVLALAAVGVPPPCVEAARLDREVVPVFQRVALRVDADQTDYDGSVEITLQARQSIDRLRLHARDIDVTSVTLRGPDGEADATHEAAGDELLIRLAAPLAPAPYELRIAFRARFNTRAVALYRMEQDGRGYAFTQFQPDDARGAFPCFDEPGFKIPWQLTVAVPEGHLAVSNTPAESETVEGGWRTTVFRKTKPLPSYLVALATGPLDTVDMPGLGVPGRIVTLKGQTGLTGIAVEQTPPILRALESYFGQPYPYEKLDFIAIPEYWAGAMEHPGAITYAANLLLLDPQSASLEQKRRLAKVIAHELAHQWFGNLVTMQWWDDLWLNESFADWMGDKVTHEVFPRFRMDLQVVDDAESVMAGDSRPTAGPIRRPVSSQDSLMQDVVLQYRKGKAVLNMFESWIGRDVWRKGVLAYLERHAWGNAVSADLWKALDVASDVDVSRPLATFVDQPGLPLVTVELLEGGRARLTQRRFGPQGVALSARTWSIPVALKYAASGGTETRTVLLDATEAVVDLGASPSWIHPKAEARGYYRWRVPEGILARLTAEASSTLSPTERMDLVGNLPALTSAGSLDGGRLLATLEILAGDPEPMVVAAVLNALDEVAPAFVPSGLEEGFAVWVRRALRPALDRIGLEPRAGESDTAALVRPRLLLWLGDGGRDAEVRRFAEEKARSYLEDPGLVSSSIAAACLRLAMRDAGADRFELMRQRFEAAATPTERALYLQTLGAVRDPALVAHALEYAFSGPLRPNEIVFIPQGVRETPEGRERAYRWMTESYARLAERLPPDFMGFLPFFAGGCSADRLEAARAFFSRPEHQAKSTERVLGRTAAAVEECLALRAREGQSVRRFLEDVGPESPPAVSPPRLDSSDPLT